MRGIVIENVTKSYLDARNITVQALSTIDLEIASGEFVCLIGKSGCGKTTLLNIIAGFVTPSTGRVLVDGERVTRPGQGKGMVFQQFALFPWLTAIGNIDFALKQRNLDKATRQTLAAELIGLIGLKGFEEKYPYQLSGGMQQRVAIARALAIDPKVLLMDEPLGALDELTRDTLQAEILRIWAAHRKTIVFVTHSVTEAVRLADRIVVMSAGPGRISQIIPISIPRPRLRTNAEVVALEEMVQAALG
ncbi:MAG: nitrate ABC transporter ATP-binding protein [Hyphomicrobiales bacterium]|nr:MAG: nitrate ABC transporter ATP-binding protein [Hyphomicrobiales bacterium]